MCESTNELRFDEKNHTYWIGDKNLPSVTQIMSPLNSSKYNGIPDSVLKTAAEKGTAVHEAIEFHIKYGIDDICDEHKGYFDAFLAWEKITNPEYVSSERKIYHKILLYAGTCDILAKINGKLCLIDIKTTSVLSDMTCGVQLEAYAQALLTLGVIVEDKYILQIKRDGKYEFRNYPANDINRWKVFCALKLIDDYICSYESLRK